LKKGLPAVNYPGDVEKPLEFDDFNELEEKTEIVPPKVDEYEWVWKLCAVVL
jgi:hypothetical protein